MQTMSTGRPRESRIEATVMRQTPPEPGDKRNWQIHQCPHCQTVFWANVRGTISYWHRNPLRRLWFWITTRRVRG